MSPQLNCWFGLLETETFCGLPKKSKRNVVSLKVTFPTEISMVRLSLVYLYLARYPEYEKYFSSKLPPKKSQIHNVTRVVLVTEASTDKKEGVYLIWDIRFKSVHLDYVLGGFSCKVNLGSQEE